MLRDFFYLPRSERRGALALIILLFAVLLFVWLKGKHETQNPTQDVAEAVVTDSIGMTAPEEAAELFSFNPNTADSATLLTLGLSERVCSNIVKYRRAGGTFRKADDVARIYGLDSATFQRIRPYILIPQERQKNESKRRWVEYGERQTADSAQRQESPYKAYMENKLPEGSLVNVNTADTTLLIRIPGIGPYFAQRIVSYRQKLGGYYSMEQLYEIENLPENLGDWLYIDDMPCRKIRVNHASLKELRDHPYIGYYRARAIMDIRKNDGRVRNIRQLSFLDEFSDADIARLEPYLDFE